MIDKVNLATDTRSRLLLTAMQPFWEKGDNSTGVADVVQAAKVSEQERAIMRAAVTIENAKKLAIEFAQRRLDDGAALTAGA